MKFENLKRVLNDFGKFLVEEYKDNLILNDKNASDELYNSVSYIVETPANGVFNVNISLLDYWKYIENGRRAGAKMPPINAIEKWIEVKPVLPTVMSNGKLPTQRQLAYLIARSISINGISPQPLLQQSVDSVMSSMLEFIEEAVAKDINNEVEMIIKGVGL